MSAFAESLVEGCGPFLALSDVQLQVLEAHYELLTAWNRRMNLTAIRGLEDAVRDHYVESLFLARCLEQFPEWASMRTLVDVGSGAGFPGFPVAVVHPQLSVLLVESHQRKSVFLREASRGLPNIQVSGSRFEALGDTWDLLVSRAVAWHDITARAVQVATRFALLVGPSDLASVQSTADVRWDNPVALPNAARGFALLGTRRDG